MNVLRSVAILLLVPAALLANPSSHGVIVIPLNPGTIRGANGSNWVTTLEAYNPSDRDTYLFGNGCSDPCATIPPHSSMNLDAVPMYGPHHGLLLSECIPLLLCDASPLALTLRTRDTSRSAENAGTDIPLPTPNDFHPGTSSIVDVPSAANIRNAVRVYWLSPSGAMSAHIAVFDRAGNKLYETSVPAAGPSPGPIDYAEALLPQFASTSSLRVEISVPRPNETWIDVPVWGFVSSTNNDTNFVTISVTRQPQVVITSVASAPGAER